MILFNRFLIFLNFLCLILANIKADESAADPNIPQDDDYVFVLNAKNFDQFINNNEFTVVFFYAPWCGHCVSMKPFYHEAAKMLRTDENIKSDKPVVFAKVDATIEKELASRFQIQGYPTLKIFRKDKSYEYEGPRRDGKAIVDYLLKESSNSWKPPVSKVEILINSNFSEWVNKYDISLVEFYSPNCGHCIRLAPNYEKAARILADDPNPIPLAKVDATAEQELSVKYNIQGYPTMLIFRKGRHYEYKGGREVDDIVNTMLKSRLSTSKEVKTINAFTSNILKPDEVYIVGLFENKDSPLFETYNLFASKYSEDLKLYHTFNTAEYLKFLKSDKIKVPALVVYYHDLAVVKNEPKFRVFEKEAATLEELEEFVFKKSLPLVSFLSPKNKLLIFDNIRPICYVFYDIDFELKSHLKYIRDKVAIIANKFNQVKFVLANETDNSDLIKDFHLEDSKSETNVVCLNEKSKMFIYDEDSDSFEQDEIISFVNKFISGKLTPYIKSDVIPKDNEKKTVKIVVGKTIDKIISTPKKEIILAFVGQDSYGKLDKFESSFTKLASKYSSNKNLYFGKINMFRNDFPETFRPNSREPSVYFIPSYDKSSPVQFKISSDSFLDDMIEFVEENLEKLKSKTETKNETKQEL